MAKHFSRRTLILCILGVALVIGGIAGLVVFLHQQKAQEDWNRQIQQYRDAKLTQYRQENAAYEDYEVDSNGYKEQGMLLTGYLTDTEYKTLDIFRAASGMDKNGYIID